MPFRPYRCAYLGDASGNSQPENSYKAYEEGFYEGVYWQSEEADEKENEQGYNNKAYGEDVQDDSVEALFSANVPTKTHVCKRCKLVLDSGNKLHAYLHTASCSSQASTKRTATAEVPLASSTQANAIKVSVTPNLKALSASPAAPSRPVLTPLIVRSTAVEHAPKKGYGFCRWRYAIAQASLGSPSATPFAVCLDTGCTMSLVDCGFLQQQCPETKINTMATPMEVRRIGSVAHNANQFVLMDIYLQGTDGRVALIQREVHLVDELKANILIGINILAPEGVSIDLSKQEAIITSCTNVYIPLSIET